MGIVVRFHIYVHLFIATRSNVILLCYRVLRAQDNELEEIPPEFETLTALEELLLGGNRLKSLPGSLKALRKVPHTSSSICRI